MNNKKVVNKILITGFFGVNNLGDDIMLEVFCKALITNCQSTITVLNLYGDKNNYHLPKEIEILDISKFRHGKTLIVAEYFSRIYDALFWIGGTCFTENAGNGIYSYMKAFHKRGKKFGYIGVGIGNVESNKKKKMYRWLLDNASLATFRDRESYKTATDWSSNSRLYLCADLVYLLENTNSGLAHTSDYMLISWRSFTGYYEKEIEDKAITELCNYVSLHKHQYSHVYIAILGNDVDIDRNKEIYTILSKKIDVIFLDSISINKKIELISGAKTVITGRLHGVFISEMNGVNTVAIGYDNKLERFMESIDANGDLVYPDKMTIDSISKAAENRVNISYDFIANQKKDALRNIELFNDLVKGL